MNLKILLYFAIYTFLGWLIESIYRSIIEKKLINSGFLYGPFCPIYGFGSMIMILLLSRISENPIIIFFVSMITLTIWEYVVGVILEKVFKTKYWDYSDVKFNLNGRICLQNSIYWGIIGVLLLKIVHPLIIENLVNLIPENILLYINIVIYTIFTIDVIVTVSKFLFIDKKMQQLHEISTLIKEKIKELKNDKSAKESKEEKQKIITNLKKKQDRIKIRTYRLIVRLKKAFPTMQSEPMNKFMEKYDKIKKKLKNKEK